MTSETPDDPQTDDSSIDIQELAQELHDLQTFVQSLDKTLSEVVLEHAQDQRPDELVERTDTGVSVTSKLKRGTGTRDQDTHTIKAKGHTVEDAIAKLDQTMERLEDRDHFQDCREYQPDLDDDGQGGEGDGD